MNHIHARIEGRAGRITLTRPKALNALSPEMSIAMEKALLAWVDDPAVELVLVDAEGDRAFCAGGDIAEIYRQGQKGDYAFARDFWRQEYQMNALTGQYPKPYVTLAQGFIMGGGVAISGDGSHRVLCESSRVAMPECMIGLIPDVGGTAILAEAPGHLGEYLGLTGHRMGPGEAIHAGFADHYVPAEAWPDLAAALSASGDVARIADFEIEAPASSLAPLQAEIDAAFSAANLTEIAARLEASDWGRETLETLRKQCALSMACTLELIRAARHEPGLAKALAREFRCTWRCVSEGELLEGIRAAVIDKDRAPRWTLTMADALDANVASMLADLGADELVLPEAEKNA